MSFDYDARRIQRVLQDFYRITKVKSVIIDSNFRLVAMAPSNECPFCAAMAEVPAAKALCDKCTQSNLLLCQKNQKALLYTCHAGLVEAVAPIFMDDMIVGYSMVGQVLQADASLEAIITYAKPFLGNQAEESLLQLDRKEEEELSAILRMMEGCVCYLLMNKLVKEEQDNPVLKIKEYLESSPQADLSTQALCRRFGISRNRLYRLSRTYFGMPIASYVRYKRLRHAQELIRRGSPLPLAAEQAGFSDYGYFGKLFKRYLGTTPLKAKKQKT